MSYDKRRKMEPREVPLMQAEDLIAMGGKFYVVDGVSFCDTPLDTWKLIPGVGYVKVE